MSFEQSSNNPVGRSEKDPFGIQHDPLDYFRPRYMDPIRMSSYGYQYRLAIESGGNSFINVGSGNHLLQYLLNTQGKSVVDFDLDFETLPDVAGKFPYLPFKDKTFDVALCFQTLEHFPFSMVRNNLLELSRVSQTIIISTPDMSITQNEIKKYRFFKLFHFPKEWAEYKERSINKEHFWEIGDGHISLDLLIEMIESVDLLLVKHFRNKQNRYHHFFVLKENS